VPPPNGKFTFFRTPLGGPHSVPLRPPVSLARRQQAPESPATARRLLSVTPRNVRDTGVSFDYTRRHPSPPLATPALSSPPFPKTSATLRVAVLAVVLEGRGAIERAWVQSYHKIGQLIHEHLLIKKERATYGATVFSDLAKASGISARTLHECVQFYRIFPIVRTCAQLGWAQYRLLCQVEDAHQRAVLTKKTAHYNWNALQLAPRVRALNAAIDIEPAATGQLARPTRPTHEPLVPQRGTPGLHLIVARARGLAVDLGFKLYRRLTDDQAKRFTPGVIVRLASDGRIRPVAAATKAGLFTYAATLRRVVDGDTLVVALTITPEIFIEQTLRLRGIDCPEMPTPAGRAARRFVEALIGNDDALTINTTKPDKFDRYLADVFFTTAIGETFLNQHLLNNHQAVRKDAADFGDHWDRL
jgi:endonuclease YncB( thermonuclease family)